MFIAFSATAVFAYTTPWHKLSAGVKDVVTGPFSIFTVPSEQIRNKDNKALAVVGGLMEGAAQSAIKPFMGVLKILTFPFVDHRFDDEFE